MNRKTAICSAVCARPQAPGEQGIDEHAEGHRPHAAEPVAEPAEQDAAGGRADEKAGGDDAEPEPRSGFRR